MLLSSLLLLFSVHWTAVALPSVLWTNSTAAVSNKTRKEHETGTMTSRALLSSTSLATIDPSIIRSFGDFFNNAPAKLSSYCLSVQIEHYNSVKATNTSALTTTFTQEGNSAPFWSNISTAVSSIYNTTGTNYSTYTPVFAPPCCYNCEITADRGRVVYWPTPAPQLNISTLVGPDGFTYTSPSVYVVYENLRGTGLCSAGTVIPNATLAFDEQDVHTLGRDGKLKPYNFADLNSCSSEPFSAGGLQSFTTDSFGKRYDPCSSSLEYQADRLRGFHSTWLACATIGGIVSDPPFALTRATALNGPGITSFVPNHTETTPAATRALPAGVPKATTEPTGNPKTTTDTKLSSATMVPPYPISSDDTTKPTVRIPTESSNQAFSLINTVVIRTDSSDQVLHNPSTTLVGASTVDLDRAVFPSHTRHIQPSETVVSEQSLIVLMTGDGDPVTKSTDHLFTVGTSTFSANPDGFISSRTVLGIDGSILSTDGVAIPVGSYPNGAASNPMMKTVNDLFTIGTSLVTLNSHNIALNSTKPIINCSPLTVDAIVVSVGTSAMIVGSKAETFVDPATPTEDGLPGQIKSGVGQLSGVVPTPDSSVTVSAVPTASSITPFTGAANKRDRTVDAMVLTVMILG